MWDKNFILQLKESVRYLYENKSISEKKCVELFGENGASVYQAMKDHRMGKSYGYGDLNRTSETERLAKTGYFDSLLSEVEKKERMEKLDEKYKKSSITKNRVSLVISIISLILSIISLSPIREWLLSALGWKQ